MADTDCIDWRITENLIEQLKTCTIDNGYNTDVKDVVLIGKKTKLDKYPAILVIPNETDFQQEYSIRQDILPFMIWFFDGKSEEKTGENYIRRMKNVHADITKCIKMDVTLNELCQNITVQSCNYGLFIDENIEEEGAYLFIEVDRIINPDNPYELG